MSSQAAWSRTALLTTFLFGAAPALAKPVVVAVHPVEVVPANLEIEASVLAALKQAFGQGLVTRIPDGEVHRLLTSPRGCLGAPSAERCAAGLAEALDADGVLLVAVAALPPRPVIQARFFGPGGALIASLRASIKGGGAGAQDELARSFASMLRRLPSSRLPSASPVRSAPVSTPPPAPAVDAAPAASSPTPSPSPKGPPARASVPVPVMIAGGLAAALAGTGGLLLGGAQHSWKEVDALSAGGRLPLPAERERYVSAVERARSSQTLGVGALVAAGAALAGGATFWVLGRPAGVSASPGGISGSW